jgi:hypothetical protein
VWLVGAIFGSRRVFEPVLDRDSVIDIEGGPDVASAVSNPVAPALNNTLKIRTMMRIFLFPPSAGSTIGGTRDCFHIPAL